MNYKFSLQTHLLFLIYATTFYAYIPDWGVKVWVGQNIYQGQPDWDVVLNGWWDEVTDPGFTWGIKYSGMMNRGKPIGHYTQVSTY